MPSRRKPNSNPSRVRALRMIKDLLDAVPPPTIIPFLPGTITRFTTFYPLYMAKEQAVHAGLTGQKDLTTQIKPAMTTAGYFVSDLIDALQNAIRRGTFNQSVRALYGLPVDKPLRPELRTEQDVLDWGNRVSIGETARIAAGGTPIGFPTLAEVNAMVTIFKNLNIQQTAAKLDYDLAQEALADANIEADKLILKLWNEIETAFDEGNKPSMRRKASEWGVVYIPSPGETPSPDDFSMMGKIMVAVPGSQPVPAEDADIKIVQTGMIVSSGANGDFFVPVQPAALYTVEVTKPGCVPQTFTNVAIIAGQITTLNVLLQPVITSAVSGTVLKTGVAVDAIVRILGTSLIAIPDGTGHYIISGITPGTGIIVEAEVLGFSPPLIQQQTINLDPGESRELIFNFP